MDRHARRLLTALEREGVLLQHDKVLPSAWESRRWLLPWPPS
jgi:hypothetical protein